MTHNYFLICSRCGRTFDFSCTDAEWDAGTIFNPRNKPFICPSNDASTGKSTSPCGLTEGIPHPITIGGSAQYLNGTDHQLILLINMGDVGEYNEEISFGIIDTLLQKGALDPRLEMLHGLLRLFLQFKVAYPVSEFVQVYFDTSGILRDSDLKDLKNDDRIFLSKIYQLREDNYISLFTLQGSLSDIFGDNDEKIKTPKSKTAAQARAETMWKYTRPLATQIREANADFSDRDIEIFNILFQSSATKDNIFQEYQSLGDNDRNDYNIIIDTLFDSNNAAFFLTRNPRDFIRGGVGNRLEAFFRREDKSLVIREFGENTLNEIISAIHSIQEMLGERTQGRP